MTTLPKRGSERAERRAAVEAAILQATAELIEAGSSFAALSVEQVASSAGIGRTAFYFYFRDKRELLMRLTEDVADQLYEQADRWFHGEGGGPHELARFVGPTARLYLEHARLLRVVAEAAMYDDDVRTFWNAVVGRFIEAARERIERDQVEGLAAPVPARETAAALIWMAERRLYQFARDEPEGDPEPVIEALTQVFVRAIYGRLPG